MSPSITVQKNGGRAIVTLQSPEKLNALTQDHYYQLAVHLREIDTDEMIFVTILTGSGRFFSAGADVTVAKSVADDQDSRRHFLQTFVANNLHLTQAFYTHSKILVTALNGPAIGLPAALVAFSDFVYATPHTYLLTPFSSLGLVTEGGASHAFVQRLGISKANEALILSKKVTIDELVHVGFVNEVFQAKPGDTVTFMHQVMKEIDERFGHHLNKESMLQIKALIRAPDRRTLDVQNAAEVLGGLERFASGVPQQEFARIASGAKKHKL